MGNLAISVRFHVYRYALNIAELRQNCQPLRMCVDNPEIVRMHASPAFILNCPWCKYSCVNEFRLCYTHRPGKLLEFNKRLALEAG